MAKTPQQKANRAQIKEWQKTGGGRGATGIGVVDRLIVKVTCPPVDSRRARRADGRGR